VKEETHPKEEKYGFSRTAEPYITHQQKLGQLTASSLR